MYMSYIYIYAKRWKKVLAWLTSTLSKSKLANKITFNLGRFSKPTGRVQAFKKGDFDSMRP